MDAEPIEVETSVVRAEAGGAIQIAPTNPFDLDPAKFSAALAVRKQNRKSLIDWIRESLVDGTDFGKIHVVSKNKCRYAERYEKCPIEAHYSKPSLFKPGAEKICGMLGLTVRYPNLEAYEQRAIGGLDIKQIILKCELLNSSGAVVAQGTGARSLAQDYNDLNKSFKMAQKSGHIDATLRLGGLSEIFTQDVEDMVEAPASEHEPPVDEAPPPGDPPAGGELFGAGGDPVIAGSSVGGGPTSGPPAAEKPKDGVEMGNLFFKMATQLNDTHPYCRQCGEVMVAKLDRKGVPYGACRVLVDATGSGQDTKELKKQHDFCRLRKDVIEGVPF